MFKINFDAAWDSANREVEIGGVVRDHSGIVFLQGLVKLGFPLCRLRLRS